MELRHLRYFVSVAEEANFTAAARRLRVAQPALSQQVKLLEEEIGFSLFSRSKRPLQLTTAGQSFLSDAKKILFDAATAVENAGRASRGETGKITIGFMGTAASPIFTRLVREYRKLHPKVKLNLIDLDPDEQREALARGKINLGFLRLFKDPSSHYGFRHIYQDRYLVALPPEHPLAAYKSIRLTALRDESFILFRRSESPFLFDHVITSSLASGFSPKVTETVNRMSSVLFYVEAGMGVSIVPSSVSRLNKHSVVYVPLAEDIKPDPLVLAWPKKQVCPTVTGFLEVLENQRKWIIKEGGKV